MKVIICDDQAIIRDGLEIMLSLESDIEVVGLAQDGSEAVELAAARAPDLILMDLKMAGMNGVEATRRIRALHPQIKILVLTTYDDDRWVMDAIRAGAAGYLLKDTPREKFLEALRGTMAGKTFIDPAVAGKLLDQLALEPARPSGILREKLTAREADVLRLLARGLSNAEIAERLHLTEGSVRNRVSAIFTKLDVTDRTQAAIIAIQYGLDKE